MNESTNEIASNPHVIVQNSIIMVTGLPGSGKSFFATFLASFYREIYSNLEIKHGERIISNHIGNIDDIKKISFSPVKGVILVEEAGVNVNSRSSLSEGNMEFSALGMLGRHKNKDIIFIAQLARTVDINIRELCKYRFDMRSWRVGNSLMFEATVYDRWGNIQGVKEIDLIQWSNLTGYNYNTLEDSILDKKKTYDKRETKEKIDNGLSFLTI